MNRAVADGAVVPVYFEPRLIPLERIQGITDEHIDDAAAEIRDFGTKTEKAQRPSPSNTVYGSTSAQHPCPGLHPPPGGPPKTCAVHRRPGKAMIVADQDIA